MKDTRTMNKQSIHILAITATLLLSCVGDASAQFSVLHSFTGGADGSKPNYGGPVVSGSTIYGAAGYGANGGGVVFSMGTDGSAYTALHTFASAAGEGWKPLGSITLSGSTIYGTTYRGGVGAGDTGYGSVFAVNTDGTGYRNVHGFLSADGNRPYGTVAVSGSKLYGMTYYSGVSGGKGSIYAVNTDGSDYSTLHTFMGGASDGATPLGGALTVLDSTVYGLAAHGGTDSSSRDGVAFSIGTDGSGYNNLFSFTGGPVGAVPYGSLTLVGSKFYGMTRYGGSADQGVVFSMNLDGSEYTTLYEFAGGASSAQPNGSLTYDGSVFYGTTRSGGSADKGTVFKINPDGSGFNILHSFDGTTEGANPLGDLAFDNGVLYGWTSTGGSYNNGTLFAVTVPEPSTWALSAAGVGLFLLVLWVRRRRPVQCFTK
jgi:uncharacterized repeat protein (TIGR03803 family)